jgi:hypothetical protein
VQSTTQRNPKPALKTLVKIATKKVNNNAQCSPENKIEDTERRREVCQEGNGY